MEAQVQDPACDIKSLSPIELKQHILETRALFATTEEVRALPDGYSLRFKEAPGLLPRLGEFLAFNRRCCGHLRHTLVVDTNGGPVWLELTGGEGVKELLSVELVGAVPDSVAAAANLGRSG